MIHVSSPRLPFGGRDSSGMGKYHGESGFDLFSHTRPVVEKTDRFDLKLRYPPYDKGRLRWLKKLFNWF